MSLFVFISFMWVCTVHMGRYRSYIVSFVLSVEDVRRLDELSRSLGVSRSRLVRDIVRRYLDEASMGKQLPGADKVEPQRRAFVLGSVKKVVVCDSCGYVLAEVPLDVGELHDTLICPRCRGTRLSLAIIPMQNDNLTSGQNTAR